MLLALLAGRDVTVTTDPYPDTTEETATATELVLRGERGEATGAIFDQLSSGSTTASG